MKKVLAILFFAALPLFAFAQISSYPATNDKNIYILKNDSYAVGFNDTYGLPVWSMYSYDPTMKMGISSVPEEWVTDSRIRRNRTTAKEFDALNLYKTQMFPKEHAVTYAEVQTSTYLTSNILPMSQSLKENIWDRITKEIEEVSDKYGKVTVYSGPLFEKDFTKNRYLIANRAVMPVAFYRMYIYFDNGKAFVKCYKFANHAPTDYEKKCPLDDFAYNFYELENSTGLDFVDQSIDASFRKEKMQYLEKRVNE